MAKAEAILSRLIVSENYDSVNNFLSLYDGYMAAPDATLEEFFPKYNPPIRPKKNTCVGLGMEVIKKLKVLETEFPGITKSMMLVSCDENIDDLVDYTTSSPGPQGFLIETEKDHVMVAIHVKIGGRPGVFLSDLGYHISRVVTVMADRCYPHTGKNCCFLPLLALFSILEIVLTNVSNVFQVGSRSPMSRIAARSTNISSTPPIPTTSSGTSGKPEATKSRNVCPLFTSLRPICLLSVSLRRGTWCGT